MPYGGVRGPMSGPSGAGGVKTVFPLQAPAEQTQIRSKATTHPDALTMSAPKHFQPLPTSHPRASARALVALVLTLKQKMARA